MGFYKYLSELWKKPKQNLGFEYKKDLMAWKRGETLVRVDRPYNLPAARRLGYKAKQGFVIIRAKIKKGGRKREQVHSGRKPSKSGRVKYSGKKSFQTIVEQRVNTRYPNLQVLNSYWVGKDGQHEYFEVICVDPLHPRILSDKKLNWLGEKQHRKRAMRGLTASGKRSRNLK